MSLWKPMSVQDENKLVRQIARVLSRGRKTTRADHRDANEVLAEIDRQGWALVRRTPTEED